MKIITEHGYEIGTPIVTTFQRVQLMNKLKECRGDEKENLIVFGLDKEDYYRVCDLIVALREVY